MENHERRIVVLGATGNQGGAVVRALKAKGGFKIIAVTRDVRSAAAKRFVADGVDVVSADMNDLQSLNAAFMGAYGVFSVQNYWLPGVGYEGEKLQGKLVAFAAKECGVQHLVYSSVASAKEAIKFGVEHFHSKFEIEEYIRGLQIPHSIVRPVAFFDTRLDKQMLPSKTSVAGLNAADRKLQCIAVDDIGFFVATMFAEGLERWNGKTLEIAGDELDGNQLAADFSQHLKRPIQYKALPGWLVRLFGADVYSMAQFFNTEGYHANIEECRKIHPGLMTHKMWLEKHFPVDTPAGSSCNIL